MNLPLSTAFTESHRFWVVVFSFSLFYMYIFISSLICWLFRSVLFSLHMFVFLIVPVSKFSRSVGSESLRIQESQHARPPVHHQFPELRQTHVHRVGDAIQPSHPLSSPSPPAPNPSQHQSLFQ